MSWYSAVGGGRGGGMYLDAVVKSARHKLTIGVPDEKTKQRLMGMAKEIGVEIPEPVVMLQQKAERLKGVTFAGVITDK